MTEKLRTAIRDYLKRVEAVFRDYRQEVQERDDDRLLTTDEILLVRLVERAERGNEFSALARATATEYGTDDFVRGIGGKWERYVGDFFRLSGYYGSIINCRSMDTNEVMKLYESGFNRTEYTYSYLAPLEYVRFDENLLDFGSFQIRRFTQEELDVILRNQERKVFYKWAHLETEQLEPFWFVYVKEKVLVQHFDADFVLSAHMATVPVAYSEYPSAIQNALGHLALYNWGTEPWGQMSSIAVKAKYDEWDAPMRPHIPFIIWCSDSLIERPRVSPDLSVLSKEPWIDSAPGEELGETPSYGVYLDESETKQFQAFMQHCVDLIKRIQNYQKSWGFVQTAMGFLVKAYLAEGLEQLLWHITAIEAVLGQKVETGVTKMLRYRVSMIVGRTEAERRRIRKRFNELYSFRSDLVHGNFELTNKNIFLGHLCEARDFARGVILWMFEYLGHVAASLATDVYPVPDRERLLAVLDMDAETRSVTAGILQDLPPQFPNVESWFQYGQ